jgi:hypothetical protein
MLSLIIELPKTQTLKLQHSVKQATLSIGSVKLVAPPSFTLLVLYNATESVNLCSTELHSVGAKYNMLQLQ